MVAYLDTRAEHLFRSTNARMRAFVIKSARLNPVGSAVGSAVGSSIGARLGPGRQPGFTPGRSPVAHSQRSRDTGR
jgi:hypothetical protein